MRAELSRDDICKRTPDLRMWREFLPLDGETKPVTLGETITPLVPIATDQSQTAAGNAGAAAAAYGAAAGMEVHVFTPEDTPEVTVKEIGFHGAPY